MTARKKESILAKLVAEPIYRQIRYSIIAEKGIKIQSLQVIPYNIYYMEDKMYFRGLLLQASAALNAKDYTRLNELACIVNGIADPKLTLGFGYLVSLDKK